MRFRRAMPAMAASLIAITAITACGSSKKSSDTTTAPAVSEPASVETTPVVETTAVVATSAASAETTPAEGATTVAAATGAEAASLKGICPDPVVVQTDWHPEIDHAELYVLSAPGGDNDKDKEIYTAPLIDPRNGKDTGVKIEIRAGGPAIGFQQVTAQMYTDPSIFLGYVNTDEAIQNAKEKPTVAIVAPRETSAQIIMWDPATYPEAKTIADLKEKKVKIRYFQGATYMEYLIDSGIVDKGQADGSYDGSPAAFVADGGKSAQQGFSTAEPYNYKNAVEGWKKDVAYQLIGATGYDIYGEAIAVKPATLTEKADCLKALVPMFQAAQVKLKADPKPTTELIANIVAEQNKGWQYSVEQGDAAVVQSFADGIIGNGPNATLGDLDDAKIQKLIDVLRPIFAKQNAPIPENLKPSDIYTNQFIDTSIGVK